MRLLRRISRICGMPPVARRLALRRWRDHVLGSVLLGWIGTRLNRSNRFMYLSYVPDSIHAHAAIPDLGAIVRTWTHKNARRNGGDVPRLLFLVQNAQHVLQEGVPGHFAELGVHKGNSAKVLADALSKHGGGNRRIFLFDTFGGFDGRDLKGVDESVAAIYSDTSLGAVRKFVGSADICDYRPGYFPETAADIGPELEFALVHLDCDLYEPTRAALAFFYPRLSVGGLMVLHDYSSGHWPGIPKAVDEFLAGRPEHLVLLPDKSGTAVFRKQ